jgi:hypothetical protein
VSLIIYYVAFMIVGDFAAYLLGLFTEYEWGSFASLMVFLSLYFLSLWVSWVLHEAESTIRGKRSVKSLPGRLAVRRSTISPLWLIAHIQGRCFGAESDRKMRPTMTPLWSRHRERRRKSVGHGLAIKPDD